MNKYGAVRTYSELCQRAFDSRAEARRGENLAMLQREGEISDLEYQVRFVLCDKPKVSITLDFAYTENGEKVYEDVKGVETREFRVKLAWLKEKHGVEVRLMR